MGPEQPLSVSRRAGVALLAGGLVSRRALAVPLSPTAPAPAPLPPRFSTAENGLRTLDVSVGKRGAPASPGCDVAVAFRGRLAAKNGWVFTSELAEDEDSEPLSWTVGKDDGVLAGLDLAVRGMRPGGVRRVVVPPKLGYVSELTRPVPREFWQRRRLFSTVFNQTRIANGEGDTLATTIWDVELLRTSCPRE